MQFPGGYNGFVVPFTFKVIHNKVKFVAIISELYNININLCWQY